jgi:protein phosphatase
MVFSKLDCHAMTHVGHAKSANEDQFLVADLIKAVRIQTTSLSYDDQSQVAGHSHGKIFLVADGLGGHAAGRRASTLAVDETINYMVDRMRWHHFSKTLDNEGQIASLTDDLASALEHCQRRIRNEADLNADKQGMATTLTIGIVDWPTLHLVHAGDSRCYLHRNHRLQQLTRDHTLAQALADDRRSAGQTGQTAPDDTLWNVVGGKSERLESEVHHIELAINDTLLLCTDGLTKHVPDHSITEVLDRGEGAKPVCEELVDLALAGGGSDNITVAVARFLDVDDPAIGCIKAVAGDQATDSIQATDSDQAAHTTATAALPTPQTDAGEVRVAKNSPVESPRTAGRIQL